MNVKDDKWGDKAYYIDPNRVDRDGDVFQSPNGRVLLQRLQSDIEMGTEGGENRCQSTLMQIS